MKFIKNKQVPKSAIISLKKSAKITIYYRHGATINTDLNHMEKSAKTNEGSSEAGSNGK